MKRKTARLQEKKAEEGKKGFNTRSDTEEKQRRLQVSLPWFSPRLLQGLSEDSATRWKSRWHILSILLTALVGSQKAAKNKPKPLERAPADLQQSLSVLSLPQADGHTLKTAR